MLRKYRPNKDSIIPRTAHRAPCLLGCGLAGRQAGTGHRVPGTVLLLLLLLLFSCQDGPDGNQVAVEKFVAQQVEERLVVYQKILQQQCREKVLEEAGRIADSILIQEARLRRDSLGKPPKPTKPERPEMKQLKDSLRLNPLFPDTLTGG